MRVSRVVVGWVVAAVVVATPIVAWVVSWTTAEHVCVAEDNLASHTNRSTTYYEVRTSCGLLKVRADLQEQVRDVVEDGGTYRMVIEERHVVRYLVEVPELEDDGDALGS